MKSLKTANFLSNFKFEEVALITRRNFILDIEITGR